MSLSSSPALASIASSSGFVNSSCRNLTDFQTLPTSGSLFFWIFFTHSPAFLSPVSTFFINCPAFESPISILFTNYPTSPISLVFNSFASRSLLVKTPNADPGLLAMSTNFMFQFCSARFKLRSLHSFDLPTRGLDHLPALLPVPKSSMLAILVAFSRIHPTTLGWSLPPLSRHFCSPPMMFQAHFVVWCSAFSNFWIRLSLHSRHPFLARLSSNFACRRLCNCTAVFHQ